MNRIKLVLGLLATGAVCSASAQNLQFTNLTLSTSPSLFHGLTNQLNSVVFGGSSNFLAVGANQIYVYGNFQPGQTWITNSGWVTNQIIPAHALNLASVTIGSGTFVTTGTSNVVFSAANVFSPDGLGWSQKHNIFSSSVFAPAIAYNGSGFAAVAGAPAISWSSTSLPTLTTWSAGTLTNIDFVESFRGVTPYGANGFAACGLFADVRLSANGTNWQAAVSGKIGLPDLYAIAWDGAQTLVAVGATNSGTTDNGIIMVSTNSGNTIWKNVYTNNTASTPLNAVTYTGSGFIAVGNKGLVLTSTNGLSWTLAANAVSPANINLYGVAYATNGYLKGVAELVGATGAVVLAATPPPVPTNPSNEVNCSGSPLNNPLSVTLVTDANHPAGAVGVDWYDAHGNLVANNSTSFSPANNPNLVGSNVPTNFIYNAVERDLRTGFTSAVVQVTQQINPRPTAKMVTTNTICNGASVLLEANLTGIGPWTVMWSDGYMQSTNAAAGSGVVIQRVVSSTEVTNLLFNNATNYIFTVTGISNADTCMGNQPGDITGEDLITVNPRPTAIVVTTNTICNGGVTVLQADLTGLGPWTVTWSDGYMQSTNAPVGSGAVAIRTVLASEVTNLFLNAATNYLFSVTGVANQDTCSGNRPGDILGLGSITVNPRPESHLAPLNVTACNDGSSYVLTSTLTGIGPWTVIWNDTTVETTNTISGFGPVTLVRTVFPTNSFGANAVSNNVYSIAIVTNSDMCMGNQPGDITGTNTISINPRPTATLLSYGATNCNVGKVYTLTNILTGIGPWTIYWNDGTTQSTNGAAPLTLTRNVTPTTSSANAASNNVYFVTLVTNDTDMCIGNESGDITGTNSFLINPLPTATLTITTNDFALSTNGVATALLESVSQTAGTSYNLVVGFQALQNGNPYTISNQTLSVTNHLAFTGIGPWAVILSDGNTAIPTNFTANGTYVWNEVVSTNFNTNFTFSVTSVTDTNSGCSGSETNVYSVGVYGAPTAAVAYTTNTVCGSGADSVMISAALGGFGPWTNIVWSDGYVSGQVSNSPVTRNVNAPTNNSFVPIATNISIVSLTDGYGITTTSSNDLTGAATFNVDPFPTVPPTAVVATNYTCPAVAIMLSVSVPPNFTADWFADSTLTNNLALGTTNFVASITNEPGTNIYYVTMRYNDVFSLSHCSPEVATSIYLISEPCTNVISSIASTTNGTVVISWSGNYILQGTTNLVPPTVWFPVSTGALGPNFLTNSALNGYPYEFFRLYAPTN